jgi:DNA-binding IclR family transcriptional regulator
VTTLSRSRSRYNQLKKRTLEIFARQGGWLSPPEWAVLAGFYPTRAAYTYLVRLHRFGLLRRSDGRFGVRYSLSRRGLARLVWLRS